MRTTLRCGALALPVSVMVLVPPLRETTLPEPWMNTMWLPAVATTEMWLCFTVVLAVPLAILIGAGSGLTEVPLAVQAPLFHFHHRLLVFSCQIAPFT